MGIVISLEHSLKPIGESNKALMFFSYESTLNLFTPISAIDFINCPSLFKTSIIIIEPLSTTDTKSTTMKITKNFKPISMKELSKDIHTNFKILQFKLQLFKMWILISNNFPQENLPTLVSNCRSFPFQDYFSTKSINIKDIFVDISDVTSLSDALKPPSGIYIARSTIPLHPINTFDLNKQTPAVKKSRELLGTVKISLVCSNSYKTEFTDNPIAKSNDCDFVTNGLFIGGEAAARNRTLLLRLGITHIVTLNHCDSLANQYDEFSYFPVPLLDSVFEDLNPTFWKAVQYIDHAIRHNGTVLVHCRRGISRSAALCVAYLMDCRRMEFNTAVSLVKKQRPIVNINSGFLAQLQSHEKDINKQSPQLTYISNLAIVT